MTEQHPVTLGDLRVKEEETSIQVLASFRPATVADLVSALRAEGVLDREWRCWREDGSYHGPCNEEQIALWKAMPREGWAHRHSQCGWQLYWMESDALAEAQPFPPAGEKPKDPWDYDP